MVEGEITGRGMSPGELKWQGDLQGGAEEAVLRTHVELGTLSICRRREDREVSGVQSLTDSRKAGNKQGGTGTYTTRTRTQLSLGNHCGVGTGCTNANGKFYREHIVGFYCCFCFLTPGIRLWLCAAELSNQAHNFLYASSALLYRSKFKETY
jgi:hypothetical protein